ncbi:acyltransferase [Flavimobilis marinus]|uniref:Peptidoglycan/LPS O-acetylase OafA/YrhL, contains acyltransferase and SGNH-hydrolase domains n=1 Tax=Flavimobilis marinus TaxID=285351 RepID=A0A1I2DE04_9MICO|nr:acyltransferase family protein [Flavimobilis marinus]GHG45413.1 acyltransferase [Flavimobilis marinus]SFE78678.1 Peptidoglycan/LPS O-acetylase OafA/YrhL, contains acyltransferase and SGNH-hydrolase domains [Flavimobilis marinus]
MSGTTAAPQGGTALDERSTRLAPVGREHFRTDVEGLRAVAVLAVVAFHASVPGFTGGFVGVDVFFVISGFLITGLLLREAQGSGRIDFFRFYARRARRIIPPAALVLVVVCLASFLLEPLLGVYNTSRAVLASGLFAGNWHFIGVGTDYFASSAAESPVLHYWSLAVEEQFYLVWPLLVLASFTVAKRFPLLNARLLTLSVVLVTAVSFAYSVVTTSSDPVLAYMATTTRAWEFGVGGIVATVAHWLQLQSRRAAPRRTGYALGWAGLAAVLWSVVAFDEATPFPGSAALVPTLGTAAIIAGGILVASERGSIGAFLSRRPVRYIGRLSFAWYLWHWPVLVLVENQTGQLPWQERSVLMLGALLLAVGTLHLFEIPLGRWRQIAVRATAATAVGFLGVSATTAAALVTGSSAVESLSSTEASVPIDTATFEQVFGPDRGTGSGPVSPNPLDAPGDEPVPADCLHDKEVGLVLSCTLGPPGGTPVVLFGDSHAHQWLPAFDELAATHGWEVSVFAKAGCPVQNIRPRDDDSRFSDPECVRWRAASIEAIHDLRPELVVVSSLHTYLPDKAETLAAWEDSLERLREAGAPIAYLRDTPNPEEDIPTCISSAFDDWSRCSFPHDGVEEPVIQEAITGRQAGVTVIDLLPLFCDGAQCAAVRNGLLLYRDDSHITATAARSLAPALEAALRENEIVPST